MKFNKNGIRSGMLLYAITDRMWLEPGESLVYICRPVLENGTTSLQIRKKDLNEGDFEKDSQNLKDGHADGVAVVSAIFGAENPGEATADLLKLSRDMVQHG